ncbi:hypothetical protein [Alkalihalobacillus sp. 1P02AB]|uniref:hypothetical protein n=1 Tax=Alkalihalobacillus sp. 1P02AB TaxID=3132260 RepID=UPI0039A6CD2E
MKKRIIIGVWIVLMITASLIYNEWSKHTTLDNVFEEQLLELKETDKIEIQRRETVLYQPEVIIEDEKLIEEIVDVISTIDLRKTTSSSSYHKVFYEMALSIETEEARNTTIRMAIFDEYITLYGLYQADVYQVKNENHLYHFLRNANLDWAIDD